MGGWTAEQVEEWKRRTQSNSCTQVARSVVRHDLVDPLNKTERSYADYQEMRRIAGEIKAWVAHPFSANLRKGVRYTPDFLIVENDGTLTLDDTKAERVRKAKSHQAAVHVEPDARVRLMWAANMFPWFRWRMAWKNRTTGEWMTKEFKPEVN